MPSPFLWLNWKLAFQSFLKRGKLSRIVAAPIVCLPMRRSRCYASTGTKHAGFNKGFQTGEHWDCQSKAKKENHYDDHRC